MKPLDMFYEECIRSKIALCESKARASGRSQCSKRKAELYIAQAVFFEDEKERLIEEMLEEKESLGRDLMRICSFLNESFFIPLSRGIRIDE